MRIKEFVGIILVVAGSLFIANEIIKSLPEAPCEKTQSC